MAGTKFDKIYEVLKQQVLDGQYDESGLLPTEAVLVEEFSCSRNTVRRAIDQLNKEGLVYSVKGRGVVVLESKKREGIHFKFNNFHGLKSLPEMLGVEVTTKVLSFKEMVIDQKLSEKTGFSIGDQVVQIRRIRYLDGENTFYDTSYFKCDIISGLSKEIAENSIYQYIEKELGITIAAKKVVMHIELATEEDKQYLNLGEYNCVGILENFAYTDMGKLFEYTESRELPNKYTIESFETRPAA